MMIIIIIIELLLLLLVLLNVGSSISQTRIDLHGLLQG
jgi:hypothetical protein